MSYHSGIDSISSSGVKMLVNKTPAHFHQRYAEGAPEAVSRPLVFGSVFHAFVLEGEAVCRSLYGTAPAHPGTAKYAAWLSNEECLYGGLKEEDWAEIQLMQAGMLANEEIKALLDMPAIIEQRFDWTDKEYDVQCKIKPDFLARDGSVMLDIKTTADATNYGIHTAVRRYDYDLSAAMYLRAIEAIEGITPRWGWIFIEKGTRLPRLVWASDETIETGSAKLERGLSIYSECMKSGKWPGYETLNL